LPWKGKYRGGKELKKDILDKLVGSHANTVKRVQDLRLDNESYGPRYPTVIGYNPVLQKRESARGRAWT